MRFSLMVFVLSLFAAQTASAAWHDRYAGAGLRVHHVQLTGHGGDNVTALRNIAAMHEACIQHNRTIGRVSQPLPASGLPIWATAFEIDIYYASNRTLEVKKSLHHSVDPANCALDAKESTNLTWFSSAGKCDADVAKKTASGQCDSQQHAKSIALKANENSASTAEALAKIDMSKLPPDQRAKVEASLKSLNITTPTSAEPVKRVVAGHQCRLYEDVALNIQRCLAQPDPRTIANLNPFPIPPATLNGNKSGVLIEMKSLAMTLTAKVVAYSLAVSPDLFIIPSDYRLSAPTGGKP
jgi:hypothetical protein